MINDSWELSLAEPAVFPSFDSYICPPPPSTTTPPSPPPSPEAKCTFSDDGFFYLFEVHGIQLIKENDLHRQENGHCALTGRDWHNTDSSEAARAFFNLPFLIKAGFVERAIASEGGPKISCEKGGICWSGKKKVNAPVMPMYTEEQMEEFKETYEDNITHENYQPEIWSRG